MPYYLKVQNRELGPFEERIVIAHLIDGEINSRSLIKDGIKGEYHKIEDTPFNAVLPKLTARWRYNIGALKREHIFLLISLLVTLVPMLNFLFGLYNNEWRSILLNAKCMGAVFTLSVIGFFSTCYFTWMFAYRCYRVVPKSQYNITPGWRIMLTFIPLFRLGWNYCMWCPLATKLKRLTNYSMNCGRAAAIFYSTSMIVMTIFIYLVIFFNWSHRILDLTFAQAMWKNLVGGIFVGFLILSFIFTVVSFIVMTFRLKEAALAILRHRYAYNVVGKKVESPFMLSVLTAQRKRDKARRWGHGLGIGGVMVLWPLLFIGIPYLVLYIVGTVKINNAREAYLKKNLPFSIYEYQNASSLNIQNCQCYARYDEFNNRLKNGDIERCKIIIDELIQHAKEENNAGKFTAKFRYAVVCLSSLYKSDLVESLDVSTVKRYYDYLTEAEDILEKSSVDKCVQFNIRTNDLYSKDRIELFKDTPGLYLYSFTPFCLISRADMSNKCLDLVEAVLQDYYKFNKKNLRFWQSSNVILNYPYTLDLIEQDIKKISRKKNFSRKTAMRYGILLQKKSNNELKLPEYMNAVTGEILTLEDNK